MTQKKEVIINLNLPLTISHSIDQGASNLQQNALEQVHQLLENFIKNNESDKNEPDKNGVDSTFVIPRRNNTIYINGERGAGKTTFLLDVLKKYEQQSSKKIMPVAFIDPTLIQTNQNILIEIVSALYKKADSCLVCGKDETKKRELNEAIVKMSEGLKLLDLNDNNPKYNDSSWYLEKSLKDATSGQCLEKNLHDFIKRCSELCKTELFIIAIDDVDTKTDKAYEVLEIIRCYLTHPQLSIIISGDLELYSHIVKNIKTQELLCENAQRSYSENMVTHLEQQYLAKILPLEHRVTLDKMLDLLFDNEYKIQIKHNTIKSHDHTSELTPLVNKIFSEALEIPEKYIGGYTTFILMQPIRTILQFLKAILSSNEQDIYKAQILKEILYNIFISYVTNEKFQINNTSKQCSISQLSYEYFQLLNKNNELEADNLATLDDFSIGKFGLNTCKAYITATNSMILGVKNNAQKLGNSIAILLMEYGNINLHIKYGEQNIENVSELYNKYLGVGKLTTITDFSARMTPIIMKTYTPSASRETTKIGTLGGIIRTMKSQRNNRLFHKVNYGNVFEGSDLKDFTPIQSINTLLNIYATQTPDSMMDYIATQSILISSLSLKNRSKTEDYISCYLWLAGISELLSEDSTANFREKLEELRSVKTYSIPHFLQEKEETSDDDIIIDEEFQSNTSDQYEQAFIDLMIKWKEQIGDLSINPLLIEKICNRIFYTLNNISNTSSKLTSNNKKKLLPQLFSQFIWSVINAYLIEECRYSKTSNQQLINSIKKADNTNESSKLLVMNLTNIFKQNDQLNFKNSLPITHALISCPLIHPYIFNDTSELLNIIHTKILDSKFQNSIKSILQKQNISEEYFITIALNNLNVSRLIIMGCFRDPDGTQGMPIKKIQKELSKNSDWFFDQEENTHWFNLSDNKEIKQELEFIKKQNDILGNKTYNFDEDNDLTPKEIEVKAQDLISEYEAFISIFKEFKERITKLERQTKQKKAKDSK
ncbi:hypothetical protein B9T12_05090 [Wohlfahrtiimonas chitiniclastica]|uniref:P-loop NTPase fold protein n=1 Tax=Wohlfahrtiimonas chitiniclastica TaxID=400946 RepID=UPI000B98835D|nr:P-loop NTPase fold protein [Wohlfahrtiimonas chitiniclastica]OYQ78229.1 hypothetical protein B9T12_05090 [Wohlfahrtiimonas chitiniclastica]